jgi:hypothetical protein
MPACGEPLGDPGVWGDYALCFLTPARAGWIEDIGARVLNCYSFASAWSRSWDATDHLARRRVEQEPRQ